MDKETSRLEAFSDGVIAILITIMVLEMKVPHGAELADLRPILPVFLSYLLSFVYLGIYWNNHHQLIGAAKRAHGALLWTNLHLLFWLSLIPFTTGWMGQNHNSAIPTALYGVVLFMAAVSYTILQGVIVADHGPDSKLARAIGQDWKGKFSLACYAASIVAGFYCPLISDCLFVLVALIWVIPDRRVKIAPR